MRKNKSIIIIGIIITLLVGATSVKYGQRYYYQKVVQDVISSAFEKSNSYSWKDLSFVNGIEYFAPALQEKYFLKEYAENIKYIKDNHIVSSAKVLKYISTEVNDNSAKASLVLSQTQYELSGVKKTWTSDVIVSLNRNKNKRWIITNVQQANIHIKE